MIVLHIKFSTCSLKKLQDLGYTLTPLALDYLEFKYSNHHARFIAIRESKGYLKATVVPQVFADMTIGLNRASELLTLFNLGFNLDEAYDTIRGNL